MDAIKNLNGNIITREAGKTNQYVIMNHTDYKSKLDQ